MPTVPSLDQLSHSKPRDTRAIGLTAWVRPTLSFSGVLKFARTCPASGARARIGTPIEPSMS